MIFNSSPTRPRGRPVDESDPAARPGDPHELLRDDLVARCGLDAECGKHAVKAPVLERELFGVALDPVDRDALLGGPAASGLEQLGRQVSS